MDTLISTCTKSVELTVSQRLELLERVRVDFDSKNFEFETESITDEEFHNMIDNYYPYIPRKVEAVLTLELRKH